jgi:hypothetical protein
MSKKKRGTIGINPALAQGQTEAPLGVEVSHWIIEVSKGFRTATAGN